MARCPPADLGRRPERPYGRNVTFSAPADRPALARARAEMGENGAVIANPDDERPVELSDDELVVLPDQTRDDSDIGWGDYPDSDNDARLLEERPPHW